MNIPSGLVQFLPQIFQFPDLAFKRGLLAVNFTRVRGGDQNRCAAMKRHHIHGHMPAVKVTFRTARSLFQMFCHLTHGYLKVMRGSMIDISPFPGLRIIDADGVLRLIDHFPDRQRHNIDIVLPEDDLIQTAYAHGHHDRCVIKPVNAADGTDENGRNRKKREQGKHDELSEPVMIRPENKPDREKIACKQDQKRHGKTGHEKHAMFHALSHIQLCIKQVMPWVGEYKNACNQRAGEKQCPKPSGRCQPVMSVQTEDPQKIKHGCRRVPDVLVVCGKLIERIMPRKEHVHDRFQEPAGNPDPGRDTEAEKPAPHRRRLPSVNQGDEKQKVQNQIH